MSFYDSGIMHVSLAVFILYLNIGITKYPVTCKYKLIEKISYSKQSTSRSYDQSINISSRRLFKQTGNRHLIAGGIIFKSFRHELFQFSYSGFVGRVGA